MTHRPMILMITALLFACSPREPTADEADGSGSAQKAARYYQPTGWPAKTLPEIAEGLRQGEVSAEALVNAYLERIEQVDFAGPTLQSVLTINPDALAQARALDERRANGEPLGPLHGVPILLKDNIESADRMATTAGALALENNITGRDSPLVAGLRQAGAIILGKTNLSQWANFRSNNSMSGWSALGGQVRNPHMLDRNTCGSSSGSGAAMAASLAAGTVGTETNGSIICPSNANGIVGFKPTVGLVPQEHIIPISFSQDTAGPMTKSVRGAATMLNAMAVGDVDYTRGLSIDALDGKRIGVLRFAQGGNQDIVTKFNTALKALEAAGAELVEIKESPVTVDGFWTSARAVLDHEFKTSINAYLASTPEAVTVRNLDQLIAFNQAQADIELALFDQSIFIAANETGGIEDAKYAEAVSRVQQATRQDGIDRMISEHQLDILVAPSGAIASRVDPINGDVWPSFPGAGWMAAIAGYPHATVPMGTIHGMSVGISFMGSAGQDADILAAAYAYEQATLLRVEPAYLNDAEDRPEIATAMKRR